MKSSEARVQSFGIKFNFITRVDQLIIQATCSKDNQQYIAEILSLYLQIRNFYCD